MATYRIYWLGPDDHIKKAENFECTSDAGALELAKQRIGAFPAIEVWHGTTCVGRSNNNAS